MNQDYLDYCLSLIKNAEEDTGEEPVGIIIPVKDYKFFIDYISNLAFPPSYSYSNYTLYGLKVLTSSILHSPIVY